MDNHQLNVLRFIIEEWKRTAKKFDFLLVLLVSFWTSSAVLAIDIAQKPLFLDQAAVPNVMFILDDSGSMDWEILTVPHFEAYNYDRDANRSWARGGWLNWDYRNRWKVTDGDWISYAGYCHDRNADGICYDILDLNGDGDSWDGEITATTASSATYEWHLGLRHLYHWNWYEGKCVNPSSGSSDASDYLPDFGEILAWLSQSSRVQAHTYTGTSWNTSPNKPYAGMTDPVYEQEVWKSDGENDTYNYWNPAAQATAQTNCVNAGKIWKAKGNKELVHTGSTPWSSAGSLTNTTSATPTYTPGNVGDYHQEYLYNTGSAAVAATTALDINGDGATNTPVYYERDDWGIKRVRYHYLHELKDNTYVNPYGPFGSDTQPWRSCAYSSNYSSVDRCNYLRYWDFPNGYFYNATAPAPATSPYGGGNQKILTLPTFVPRIIQPTWPNPPAAQVRFDTINWAPWSDPARGISNRTNPVGTHHALNKWDPWPVISDWRIRSSSFNVLYYDPQNDYKPWPGLETPVSSFTAARSNPEPGTVGYSVTKNLARPHTDYDGTFEEGGFVYEIWHDDAGFWSDRPQWHSTDQCDTAGWKISHYSNNGANNKYGAGMPNSVVAGITDPATGNTVTLSDRVCYTYNDVPNSIVDLWDKRDRVTVYTDKIVVQTVRRTPHIFGEPMDNDNTKKVAMSDTRILNTVVYDPANYSSYSTDAFCIATLGEDPNNPGHCRTLSQVQTNIATWYEFSRRRSFVAKGAIANLIKSLPNLNYGLMGTSRSDTVAHNKTNATNLSKDLSKLFRDVFDGQGSGNGDTDRVTHNNNLITALYDHVFRKSGTPLRQALQRAGEYFAGRGPLAVDSGDTVDHNTSPITEACQKNFAVMLTDGYRSGLVPADVTGTDRFGNTVTLDNADSDSYDKTLADVAKYYYDEDLSPLDNIVPTDSFDENNAQHLSLIGIGFGVTGNLTDPDGDGWPGVPDSSGALSYTESSDWGNPNNNPRKLDDLWHAAYNSRGLYLNAKNPAELITKLNEAILFATSKTGSASAVTSNSPLLTASTRIYQTLFKSGEWTGDVKSYSVNTLTGKLIKPANWSAQGLLDAKAATDRRIFTLGVSGGIPFRWSSLVDASSATSSIPDQQMALRKRWSNGNIESVDFGKAQLDFIRGKADPQFRSRTHKLGDIVHSDPLFVDSPSHYISSTLPEAASYSAFVAAYASRNAMLYVGANDGMLHAFDAGTGEEKFAYIPQVLIPKLNSLSHKDTVSKLFAHAYFVDQTPVYQDVYFSSAWHTVLVGGLRGGGKGIYALDITTVPSDTDSEATVATQKGMWEFTDKDDTDMGYSFSKPSIVRLNNGKWVAIFGNGYGSANNKAVLYIVDISDGSLIKKLDTKSGDAVHENGLSTPTVIDINNDGIADRIYAGDLLGNVWTWDISDSNVANWKTRFGTTATPVPLFTATDGSSGVQPITAAIKVDEHPKGAVAGYLLHFGTGKYIGLTDNTSSGQITQSIYAIWDYDPTTGGTIARSALLKQEILDELTNSSGLDIRITTEKSIQWTATGHDVGTPGWKNHVKDKGWVIDLINTKGGNTDNKGERVVRPAKFTDKAVIYHTLLPSDNACEGGGSSWKMGLQKENGARFYKPLFDISGDGLFTIDDLVSYNNGTTTTNVVASGVKSQVGIQSESISLRIPGGATVIISDSSTGEIDTEDPANPNKNGDGRKGVVKLNTGNSVGRKSWIELK